MSGSTAATVSAPASFAAAASASRSSTAPRKFGLETNTARGVGVDGLAQLGRVGEAAIEPHLDHLGAEPLGVGAQRLAAVRVKASRDDQLAAPLGRPDRQVGGGGHRGRPLVQRGVGDRERGELRDRGLKLEHHLQAALGDLGLVRRVRREELGALGDRVDDRRHVVVVHPRAQEADLGVGVGVARRQAGQVVEALGLGQAVGQVERPLCAHLGRNLVEELVDGPGADGVEHRPTVRIRG